MDSSSTPCFSIPTLVIVVLIWRKTELTIVAAIWAGLLVLITAQFVPDALRTFDSFFDTGLFIPMMMALIVAAVAGLLPFVNPNPPKEGLGGSP